MPLFGSSVQSTVGAGKSGAGSKKRFGPDAPWFFPLLMLLMLLAAPLALVAYGVSLAASNLRKVRSSRLAVAAAVLTAVALVISLVEGGPGKLVSWYVEGFMSLYNTAGALNAIVKGLNFLTDVNAPTITTHTVPEALTLTAPLSVPIGAWLGAFFAWWMEYRRQPLTVLEGEEYLWERPMGFLDRARERKSEQTIITGGAINPKKHQIGCGIGKFGSLVTIDTRALLTPTLVFGRPRSGKTRWTMSTLAQAVSTGGGIIVLDFKGDGEVPAFWAEFAATHGRKFQHFCPVDKSGVPYQAPAPGAPSRSAFYDPLRSGDATSKTQMLLNSVGRDGDAAAYFRAAEETVQLAYQVGRLTGYDRGRGGFEVLRDLLDMDKLQKVAESADPNTGRGYLADYPTLLERVRQLATNNKNDPIQRGTINDTYRLLSTYANGPAVGGLLRPGPPDLTIDLVAAVEKEHIVVFSLSVQDYGELARTLGTLVLLDLQNAIGVLRGRMTAHRNRINRPNAKPPWDPAYVEIEEFGAAGSDAVLNVLNKSSDVGVREFLSTQSWHDIVAVDGTGVFAKQVLAQASNFAVFAVNDGDEALVMSGLTAEVWKALPRDSKEFSGGSFGTNLKAANTGNITSTRELSRQANPGKFQALGDYDFIWIAKSSGGHGKETPVSVTHSHKPSANRWVEVVSAVLVPSDVQPPGVADVPGPDTVEDATPRQAPTGATQGAPTKPIPVRRQAPLAHPNPVQAPPAPLGATNGNPHPDPAKTLPAPTPQRRALTTPASASAWSDPEPAAQGFSFPDSEPVFLGGDPGEDDPNETSQGATPSSAAQSPVRDRTAPVPVKQPSRGSSDDEHVTNHGMDDPDTILEPARNQGTPSQGDAAEIGDPWDEI